MTDALRIALKALDDKKGHDITALDISAIASFANCFLICTGDSSRQIQALSDEVESRMAEGGFKPNHIEGYRNAEWVLMDYFDLVVHIFSRNARVFYDLERLWRDGKVLDAEKLLAAQQKPASPRKSPRARKV